MELDKGLLEELKNRFITDQKLSKDKKWKELEKIYHENSEWLKDIIYQIGWLSDDIITKQGELYAWLIVQHSPDIEFQKQCLRLLNQLPKTKERKQHLAYLTDRILVNENKRQLYGTQFSNGEPLPIEDLENLEARRENMNLESFNKYKNRMSIC